MAKKDKKTQGLGENSSQDVDKNIDETVRIELPDQAKDGKTKKDQEDSEKDQLDKTVKIDKEELEKSKVDHKKEEESPETDQTILLDREEVEKIQKKDEEEVEEDLEDLDQANKEAEDEAKDQSKVIDEKDEEVKEAEDTGEDEDQPGFLKTFLSALGNVIFALFLIAILVVVGLNTSSYLTDDDPAFFGKKMYVVGENSMRPNLEKNDAIIVEERDAKNISEGDLVVYETIDGDLVTAWVNDKLEDDRFEVKKDINQDKSTVIDAFAILGVASLKIANMGDFIAFMSRPLGILIVFLVGVVIYLVLWRISNKKSYQEG